MNAPVKFDSEFAAAARHVELLTGSAATECCFRLLPDKPGAEARKLHGTATALWPEIKTAQAQGLGTFIVVNAGGDTDAEITKIRACFVDADGIPLPSAWHVPPGWLVIRDETHWHAYWPVDDLPKEDFTRLQKQLAAHYGTDPSVCNPSRVMRLAGTMHCKREPVPITLRQITEPWAISRSADDLRTGLPEIPIQTFVPASSVAPDVELDTPANITRARVHAKNYPVLREGIGDHSDDHAVKFANELGDLGVTENSCAEILYDHWGQRCGFDRDWIEGKVTSAYKSRQNALGVDAIGSTLESFGPAIERLALEHREPPQKPQPGGFNYSLRDPVADAARPPITYRDPGRLWPDSPGGTVTQLISGPKKHKTNLILAEKVRLMLTGARVLILPLEGQYGITTQRIPALVEYNGAEFDKLRGAQTGLEYLRGRFQVADVPGFALDNSDSVDALIKFANDTGQRAGLGGWTDIVIDTQHRAAGSLEENSATDARILWNAVEHIRHGVTHDGGKRCNITLLHHVGKDESRGGRGSSADEAAVDQVLELKSDKKTLTASVYVKARKDEEDGFTVPFKITSAGASGVPILIPITDEEYRQLSGADDPYSNTKIGAALTELKAVGSAHAVKTHALAVELLRQWGELPKDAAEQEAKARSVGNRLAEKIKKGLYRGYVAHAGGEPVKPYSWSLPEWDE